MLPLNEDYVVIAILERCAIHRHKQYVLSEIKYLYTASLWRNTKPTGIFPVADLHCPLTGFKSCCLDTEVYEYEHQKWYCGFFFLCGIQTNSPTDWFYVIFILLVGLDLLGYC